MKIPRLIISFLAVFLMASWTVLAAETAAPAAGNLLSPKLQATDATAAWAELEAGNRPPAGPDSWRDTPPSPEEKQKFYEPYVTAMADRAKDFYTRFHGDTHAAQAATTEFQLLYLLRSWGKTSYQPRFETVGKALLNNTAVKGQDHYSALFQLARFSEPAQKRDYLKKIIDSDAPEKMKDAATEMQASLDSEKMIGSPVPLQFTAVDGRAVDLAKLKGKVVLVDFWATWCGPCVGEVPNVKKAYDQYHSKGFEIVGISLDREKGSLTDFITEHKMEWPQFFDGKYWSNKYAVQFGIHSIPTMWLIDKKGNLRNMEAVDDLGGNVAKLMAE